MRLIELRLKNLNSLKGEWHIDFADSAFINEGIFAITGQTGAGKTTILDAICLALYGETPRINTISKSSNEVMTRQTADCFAEVVIDLNGSHYRCRWGQRRAFNKADGNLQDATHEIAKLNLDSSKDDEILESKLSRTKDKIIELTRMDFQQFTRSILLAQGSFSAFLKAKADERADILEKITGTDIYATISEHVYEKKRFEEEILSKLQFGLQGLTLLDSEQEAELNEQLHSNQLAQNDEQQQYQQLNEQVNWLNAITELTEQLSRYQNQLTIAQQAKQDFIPNAKRLAVANSALEIESQFGQLSSTRGSVQRLFDEQQVLVTKLPTQKSILEQATNTLNRANHDEKTAASDLEQTLPKIVQVRTLDNEVKQQSHILNERNQRRSILASTVQRLSQEIETHKLLATDNQSQLITTEKYLEDNKVLNNLDTDMATFDGSCSRLKVLLQDNSTLANDKAVYSKQAEQYQVKLAELIQKQTDDKQATAETREQFAALQKQQAALLANKPLTQLRAEQEHIDHLNALIEQASFKQQQLAELSLQINNIQSVLPSIHETLTATADSITNNEIDLKEAKNQRQERQAHLALLQKVATLEDYISELESGNPCPLCGATEHPFIDQHSNTHGYLDKDNTNEQSQMLQTQLRISELDLQINAIETELSNYKINYVTTKNNLTQQQQQLATLIEQAELLSSSIQNAINELFTANASIADSIMTVIEPLKQIATELAMVNQQLQNEDIDSELVINIAKSISGAKQRLMDYKQQLRITLADYENITESLATMSKILEAVEQQQYRLATEINAVENDKKLNQQQSDNIDNKIASSFTELKELIINILELKNKYFAGKSATELSHLTEQIQILKTSIDEQVIASGTEVDHYLDGLRQQRGYLSQLKKEFNARQDQQQNLKTALSNLDTQIKTKQLQLDKEDAELKASTELVANQTKTLEQSQQHRHLIFADKNPDEEESRLRSLLEQAKTTQSLAQRQHYQSDQLLTQLQEQQQQLTIQLTTANNDLAAQEKVFNEALANSDFIDEAQFLSARLPIDERNALNQQQQQVDYTLQQTQSLLEQTQQALVEKQANPLTCENIETLTNQQQQAQSESNRLIAAIGAINQQLKDNEQRKGNQQAQLESIAEQKEKLQVWRQLNELIGSASGKKYRTFAQGLTFDIMVSHANTKLHKMSDRYLLIRDDNNALELNVIDNYQGGEIRSTKNLSGGEGFIISLALALGLSQMASHNIRVDSLFLDEGFGTLDDESLDIALDTLTNLQQEGKLIGVISHVQALKERILTQIQVTKLSGGFSQISGQGCHKIAS